MADTFDVIVIGGGPGGYNTAIRAGQLGLKTAIIEKQYWGGVCLNVGCIPTKSLLRNAELAHIFHKEADTFGIEGEVTFNFGKAFSRSRAVSDRMVKGIHYLMKKNKITVHMGTCGIAAGARPPGKGHPLTIGGIVQPHNQPVYTRRRCRVQAYRIGVGHGFTAGPQ